MQIFTVLIAFYGTDDGFLTCILPFYGERQAVNSHQRLSIFLNGDRQ